MFKGLSSYPKTYFEASAEFLKYAFFSSQVTFIKYLNVKFAYMFKLKHVFVYDSNNSETTMSAQK